MTSEPLPDADPADVAEQSQDALAETGVHALADLGAGEVPLESDVADALEQRLEVPVQFDDDADES